MAVRPAVDDGRWVTLRILVVDDSAPVRDALSRLLVIRGFGPPDTAATGEQARASISRGCPDVVLVDINLAAEDGLAVAASFAAICPAARVILTSSDVDHVSPAELRRCGAVAFLPKTDLVTTDLMRLFAG
jgi:DNA-binding NtrC family response regulator